METSLRTCASQDMLEPALDGRGLTFYLHRSARACSFQDEKVDTKWGTKLEQDSGAGTPDENYLGIIDFERVKRKTVIKLEISSDRKSVEFYPVPYPADPARDNWVTWHREKSGSTAYTEDLRRAFWGPLDYETSNYTSYLELSGEGVEITDTHRYPHQGGRNAEVG